MQLLAVRLAWLQRCCLLFGGVTVVAEVRCA